jgi:hypothetical protein
MERKEIPYIALGDMSIISVFYPIGFLSLSSFPPFSLSPFFLLLSYPFLLITFSFLLILSFILFINEINLLVCNLSHTIVFFFIDWSCGSFTDYFSTSYKFKIRDKDLIT